MITIAKVLFKFGLQEEYNALASKDVNALYWIEDTQRLYKGDILFATGKEVSPDFAGLMSPEDKAKLDSLAQGGITFKGVYESLEEASADNPQNGEIVIIGTKEYIYSQDNWVELGDEGIYLTRAEAETNYATKAELEDYASSEEVDNLKNEVTNISDDISNLSGELEDVKANVEDAMVWKPMNGVTSDISWYDAEAPEVTLATIEQFKGFSDLVSAGNDFTGKTVKLDSDLDLNGIVWQSIGNAGTEKKYFRGVFDGQGHTINNLYCSQKNEVSDNQAAALFGFVGDATDLNYVEGRYGIKNLTINGANVKGHHYCAALVGWTFGAKIEDCHVSNAKVSCAYKNADASGDKAGVLVGLFKCSRMIGCTANGSTVNAGRDAGQLIGCIDSIAQNISEVTNCSATDVTVTDNGTGSGANIKNEIIGRVNGVSPIIN